MLLSFSTRISFVLFATGDFDASSSFGEISAKAAFAVDLTTGEILYSYNADTPLPPASTTKMLTTLLVLEAVERGEVSLDDDVLVTNYAISTLPVDASRMRTPLVAGEYMSLRNLLYANMISSDCYASNVLGAYICGSVSEFVDLMNKRAAELGCEDTNYTNPSGYPNYNMYTTARALYLVAAECLKYDLFRETVEIAEYTIPATNLNPSRELYSTNMLLHKYTDEENPEENPYYYEYVKGVKTGYSKSSGYCLVSLAEKDGHEILAVVLGCMSSHDQFTESIRIFDHYYNYISKREANIKFFRDIFTSKKSIIQNNSENAKNTREIVIAEDIEIRTRFEAKHQAELNNRMQFIYLSSCICILLLVLFIIITIVRKIIRRKSKIYK